ncbi:MAG: hypothetical protein MUO23_15385 [Anaerolineales bacterium]|nr:hypothetical protein [Anaerolineales bacterium]
MSRNQLVLKASLLAGSIYFLCVGLAHLGQLKVPGLYIYYDLPSLGYQDSLIAILSLGWSAFFFTAFTSPLRNRGLIAAILISGALAILGLCSINARPELEPLGGDASRRVYWIETAVLFLYWLWLLVFHTLAGWRGTPAGEE